MQVGAGAGISRVADASSTTLSGVKQFAARHPILVMCALAVVIRAAQPGPVLFGDGYYYFMQMCSLVSDGDFDVRDEGIALHAPRDVELEAVTRGIGNFALWLPGYVVGRVTAPAAAALGLAPESAKGQLTWVAWWMGCTSIFWVLVGLFALARTPSFQPLSARTRAFLLGALVFGTPLGRYGFVAQLLLYNHGLTFALAATLFYASDSFASEPSPRNLWLAGASVGLTLVTRAEAVAFAMPFVWTLLNTYRRKELNAFSLRVWGVFFALSLGFIASEQALFMSLHRVRTFGPHAVDLTDPFLLETLFGVRNGWFVHAPLVWIAAVGWLGWAWRSATGRLALLAVALFVWVQAGAWESWGGLAWGARRMLPVVPFLYAGLAQVVSRVGQLGRARVFQSVAGVVLGWACLHFMFVSNTARAEAIEDGTRASETAYERTVGMATALPLLLWRAAQHGISLTQAYAVDWYQVLYEDLPYAYRATDTCPNNTHRYRDLLVGVRREPTETSWKFLLPLQRIEPCALVVRSAQRNAQVTLDGQPLSRAFEKNDADAYATTKSGASHWAALEVTLPGEAPPTSFTLYAACAQH